MRSVFISVLAFCALLLGASSCAITIVGLGSSSAAAVSSENASSSTTVSSSSVSAASSSALSSSTTSSAALSSAGSSATPSSASSSSTAASSVTPSSAALSSDAGSSAAAELLITEVGTCYYWNYSSWIEIYNNTAGTVQLSDYTLNINSGLRVSPYSGQGVQGYSLPSRAIPSHGYMLLRGKGQNYFSDGPEVAYLNNGDTIPIWQTSGFAELVKAGATVDCVRWGSSSATPTTPTAWNGGNAPATPNGGDADLGKSIARNAFNSDFDAASDRTVRAWATPGGKNDVDSDTMSDNDGIPDTAKSPGGTFAGLPLYDWGARQGHRDIFVHIDYMDTNNPGVIPQKAALDKVVATFASNGISIHFDVGDLFSSGVNPALYNLDNRSHKVPFWNSVVLNPGASAYQTNLHAFKAASMLMAKKQIFHYCLFGWSQDTNVAGGSSGLAELPGNDLIVTLGDWSLDVSPDWALNKLVNYQAATLMHELGHNLGLNHGGDVSTNYKPNYYSCMNYLYQLRGLPVTGNDREGDRYYWWRYTSVDAWSASSGFKRWLTNQSFDDLANGPWTTEQKLDYSHGLGSPNFDETAINETWGIYQTNWGNVDYNGDGAYTSPVSFDVNNDGKLDTALVDYNDWGNLILAFQRTSSGDHTAPARTPRAPVIPVADDVQTSVVCTPDR